MVNIDTKCGRTAFAACLAAVAIGVMVLIGWSFQVDILKSILRGHVTMNPTMALVIILSGTSFALLLGAHDRANSGFRTLLGRVCALTVVLIGLVKFTAIISGWDIGVDQWLFRSQVLSQLPLPSRMAPTATLNCLLLSLALLWVDAKDPLICFCVEFSVAVVGFISLGTIIGYAYGIQSLYRMGVFIPMALPTGFAFLAMSAAVLASHTDRGFLAIFVGNNAGGAMARRLLPAAFFIPAGLGLIEVRGERVGIYSSELGGAWFALCTILIFVFLICWSAIALFRMDLDRERAERAIREGEEKFQCEQKRIDKKMRFNEQRYRVLVEATTSIAWDTPASGKFEVEQPGWTAFTGQSFEELRGWGWLDAVHPDDREETKQLWSAAFRGLSTYKVEHRLRARDRTYHNMLVRAVPVLADDGTIMQWFGVHMDITKRKQTEEALHLLNSAVLQSKESILITGPELDLPGPEIIFTNPAFTAMTGYTAEEALGKTPRILQGALTDKAVLKQLRQSLETGNVFDGEAINYRKDGTTYTQEWQIAPIRNAKGKTTHFVAIMRDITERKALEARLYQSQKMETVGKLAGGVAHEFNSILTAIIGQSELLLSELEEGSPQAGSAIEISKAAIRAANLTRQLLAYGRKQQLEPQILDLTTLIRDMESTLDHLLGQEVDLLIVPADGLKAVLADAGQIEQVIMNIVLNAREAMPNGGKVTLETANVSISQENAGCYPEVKPGEYVLIAITDTGAGMSAEVKARIFEPFFSTKGFGQATGLGLSTSYGIIKQSGGHISAYSEPSRGTTFKIYLPQVDDQPKPTVQPLDTPGLPRGTETILLAEDDPALRKMATTLLEKLGYRVLTAANGVEALSLKQQRDIGHIDLLFTDIIMPHMSGKELSERIHSLYPHTKILFTSAFTENAFIHQGILNKGVSLLQKPFTPSVLARKLREVLDQ